MITKKTSRTRAALDESSLCQFPFADGRTCRMLRHRNHPCLCVFHAHAESQLIETELLGTELAQSLTGDFMTATDVNHVLGKLYTAVAQNRIPPRNANTLARIGRLLLTSVPGIKSEYNFFYTFEQWQDKIRRAKPLSRPSLPSLPPIRTVVDHPPATQTNQSAATEPDNELIVAKSTR